MDYKNKAIVKPDTRAVSDTRMRCLTKCLAMYGLGHYIYAGEDLPTQTETAEEAKPPPKKAPAEKPSANPDNIACPSGVTVEIFADEEEADNMVSMMCKTVDKFGSSTESELIEFWKENKRVIDLLDEKFPDQYQELKAHFSALRQNLKEKSSE